MDETQNNFVEFQSQTIESIHCMIPFIYNSRKCKLTYRDRKYYQQWPGGQGQDGGIMKGHKRTVCGDGHVHYTVSSDAVIHVSKLIQL